MKYLDCAQGSDQWHAARVAVITASKFKDATDKLKSGSPSQKQLDYAYNLAIERISGESMDDTYVTQAMRIGTEREPIARMEYESRTGFIASEAGIAFTDDGAFGYSTDGLIGEDGLIEIKSPSSARRIIETWSTFDLSDYLPQIYGGLWITGRTWCDFIMYAPQLKNIGKELFVKRIERDDDYIEQLEADLWKFKLLVDEYEQKLRAAP